MIWINRADHATADIIDRGIGLEAQLGRVAALKFLVSQGIPDPVIRRVFKDAAHRRAVAPHAATRKTRCGGG